MGLDLILLALRLTLGGFFVLARFRWFYDPALGLFPQARRASLRAKVAWSLGWNPMGNPAGVTAALVAIGEVFGGLGLIFGVFSQFSAGIIMLILLFATYATFEEKVFQKQKPVDACDIVCCYLWTVEPLYIVLAVILTVTGPGAFALAALL